MADDHHSQGSDKHPSEGAAGAVVGYLIAGIGVWGLLGWLADRWLGLPSGVGLVTGMMVGAAGAIYLIIKRLDS